MTGINLDTNGRTALSIGILFGAGIVSVGFLAGRCIRRWVQRRNAEYDLSPQQEICIERVNTLSQEIFNRPWLWKIERPFLLQGDKSTIDQMEATLRNCQPAELGAKMDTIDFQGKEVALFDVLKRFVRKSNLSRPTVQKLAPWFDKLLKAIIHEPTTQMNEGLLEAGFPERAPGFLTNSRDIRMR